MAFFPLLAGLLLAAGADPVEDEPAIRDHRAATGASAEAARRGVDLERAAVELQSRIYSDPAFAGLAIRHGERPTVAVYLKGNARAVLARYTRDPRFIPVRVALSRVELEAHQQRVMDRLDALGIVWQSTATDVPTNKVVVTTIMTDRLAAAARAGRIDLRRARVVPAYGLVASPQSAGPVTHFPQEKYPGGARMQALGGGTLILRGGCLRFGHDAGDGHLVIWPSHVKLDLIGGVPAVRDLETGRVAKLGDSVRVGGGFVDLPRTGRGLTGPIPESCAGPMFVANGVSENTPEPALAKPALPH
jgi:hypothetical protein